MSELVGFTHVSQLTNVTDAADNGISNNAQYDCVAASVLMGVMWLLGITQLTPEYNPDAVKDAGYTPFYTGATSASYYIPWCAKHGVKLSPVECGTYENALHTSHQLLAKNIPVIFTQQDDYAPLQFRDVWSHVCVFYADTASSLTCLDPYIDEPLTYSDDVWSKRLRSSELWIVEKIGATATIVQEEEIMPSITLNTPRVSDYFEASGDMWKCKQTGKIIGNAILAFYCKFGSDALCGITYAGLPLSNEISIGNGNVIQRFERLVLGYGPEGKKFDNPPGSGSVFVVKAYEGPGLDPRINVLKQQLTDANKKLNQQPDIKLQAEIAQLTAKLSQIEEIAKL